MCDHKNTIVTDSREPGYAIAGRLVYKQPTYPAIVRRRRKCLDCNTRFSTVELPIEYVEHVIEKQKN